MKLTLLTDKQLITQTQKMVKIEKKYCYEVLRHLSEIYKRRLYLDFNCNSLYEYCRSELYYTSGEAQYRVAAVKLMQKSSRIEKALEVGELPLSNAVLLHNHIEATKLKDQKVVEDLVAKIMHKSKSEAKNILEAKKVNLMAKQFDTKTQHKSSNVDGKLDVTSVSKIKFEIDQETHKLLLELAALTGKEHKQSLKELLETEVKKLKAKREKQASKPSPCQAKQTRYIPQSEKAKVLLRANGRCEHIDERGKRFSNTEKLQFEHFYPYAVGGKNTIENLKLYCQGHNQRAAIKFYGKDKIQGKVNRKAKL